MPCWKHVPIRYRHQRWVKWIDAHLPASRASVGYYETALRVEREAHLRTRHWLANAQLDRMKKDRQLTTMSRRIAAQRRQIRGLKLAVTETDGISCCSMPVEISQL